MNQRKLSKLAILWAVFFTFLLAVNPTRLPIFVLILPYILLFFALRLSWQVAEEVLREQDSQKLVLKSERSNLFAAIVVAMLALASIGQLTIRDVSTVTLLAFLGYFYMTRNRSRAE